MNKYKTEYNKYLKSECYHFNKSYLFSFPTYNELAFNNNTVSFEAIAVRRERQQKIKEIFNEEYSKVFKTSVQDAYSYFFSLEKIRKTTSEAPSKYYDFCQSTHIFIHQISIYCICVLRKEAADFNCLEALEEKCYPAVIESFFDYIDEKTEEINLLKQEEEKKRIQKQKQEELEQKALEKQIKENQKLLKKKIKSICILDPYIIHNECNYELSECFEICHKHLDYLFHEYNALYKERYDKKTVRRTYIFKEINFFLVSQHFKTVVKPRNRYMTYSKFLQKMLYITLIILKDEESPYHNALKTVLLIKNTKTYLQIIDDYDKYVIKKKPLFERTFKDLKDQQDEYFFRYMHQYYTFDDVNRFL